jgi:hypothetical protein
MSPILRATSFAEGLAALAAIDTASLPVIAQPVRYGPAIGRPGKIICVGLNYTDHAAEVGLPPPSEPTVFMKGCAPSGPDDPVRLPMAAEKGDWEVELGIVIGRGGLYIDEADAPITSPATACSTISRNGPTRWITAVSGPRARAFRLRADRPGLSPATSWATPAACPSGLKSTGIGFRTAAPAIWFRIRQIVSYLSRFYALEAGDFRNRHRRVSVSGTPPSFSSRVT